MGQVNQIAAVSSDTMCARRKRRGVCAVAVGRVVRHGVCGGGSGGRDGALGKKYGGGGCFTLPGEAFRLSEVSRDTIASMCVRRKGRLGGLAP